MLLLNQKKKIVKSVITIVYIDIIPSLCFKNVLWESRKYDLHDIMKL